jgi:PleD family two-component response regulator
LPGERPVSVFALGVDRIDALTAAHGRPIRDAILAEVSAAITAIGAPIAVIATSYPDGVFALVAPQLAPAAARALGHALRSAVSALGLANPEAIAADRVTVSIGIVTARRARSELIAEARRLLKEAASTGGNKVVAVDLSAH